MEHEEMYELCDFHGVDASKTKRFIIRFNHKHIMNEKWMKNEWNKKNLLLKNVQR